MCSVEKAALVAMEKSPESLVDAVQYVSWANARLNVIMRSGKSDIKRVTFEDTQDSSNENFSGRAVSKEVGNIAIMERCQTENRAGLKV